MKKLVPVTLILLAALGSVVRAQHGEEVVEVIEGAPQPRFALLPGRRLHEPVPQSAEEAEDIAAAGKRPERFWLRAEFLVWWIKTANLPPLVTTGELRDPRPGSLDSARTRGRFGAETRDFQERGGGRFTAGWWLDDEPTWAIVGSYFFINGRSLGLTLRSVGSPVLARPFTNVQTGQQDASLIAYPGIISGSVAIDIPSFLQGAELNLLGSLANEHGHVQALGGFRFLNLDDGLHINEVTQVTLAPQYKNSGIPYDGRTIAVRDRFDTRNDFYGGQLGIELEARRGRFSFDLIAKAALGVSHQVVNVRGFTAIDGLPSQDGGLLAVASNSGRFTRNAFAVVPETAFNINFNLTNRLRVFGGYSFLYWSSVARPWEHVNLNVNPNFVPASTSYGSGGGPALPAFTFRSTSFFAHGANFGVEFRY